jgi:hypothetical protein
VGTKDDEYAKREIENTPNYSYLKADATVREQLMSLTGGLML